MRDTDAIQATGRPPSTGMIAARHHALAATAVNLDLADGKVQP
jgi:hypothetical protein